MQQKCILLKAFLKICDGLQHPSNDCHFTDVTYARYPADKNVSRTQLNIYGRTFFPKITLSQIFECVQNRPLKSNCFFSQIPKKCDPGSLQNSERSDSVAKTNNIAAQNCKLVTSKPAAMVVQ